MDPSGSVRERWYASRSQRRRQLRRAVWGCWDGLWRGCLARDTAARDDARRRQWRVMRAEADLRWPPQSTD